jgi:lipid-A-disaccharide synthase
MERLDCMLIAGEASGDLLAAELVEALRQNPTIRAMPWGPRFFGAGGPAMAAAGVELALDLTEHAVVGLTEVLKHYRTFQRLFRRLIGLACERQPDLIILVDFSGFNRRLARALRRLLRRHGGLFNNWRPRLVQYVSPQVWASRPGRAYGLAQDIDLLLCLFPFEKEWYSQRLPRLRVEFVGHPVCERFPGRSHAAVGSKGSPDDKRPGPAERGDSPLILLLPGSREREVRAHLPVMLQAAMELSLVQAAGASPTPASDSPGGTAPRLRWRVILPNEQLAACAREQSNGLRRRFKPFIIPDADGRLTVAQPLRDPLPSLEVRVGGLAESLAEADLALAASGTVTVECAWFGVPTVVLYKTSWLTYHIAKRIVTVPYLAMPNLLAGEMIYPEFIQGAATPSNLARAASELLFDLERRRALEGKLAQVVQSLGGPGASARAAQAILRLFAKAGGSGAR